ncbi:hypothetical protein [Burkholderia ubonensis]|uniref:hypothetical protein n=1 Tax=Burkholderia ubonensis TaxID=101571 RepID=UPI000AC2E71E|nr:hypothetical protein [Burkholderia ubonensis]
MSDDLIELIRLIEERPTLYLSRGTISALKAFVDGWAFRRPDEIINYQILSEVQKRVEFVFGVSGHSWDKIILLFSEDEHDALKRFFLIFNELCDEKLKTKPD